MDLEPKHKNGHGQTVEEKEVGSADGLVDDILRKCRSYDEHAPVGLLQRPHGGQN